MCSAGAERSSPCHDLGGVSLAVGAERARHLIRTGIAGRFAEHVSARPMAVPARLDGIDTGAQREAGTRGLLDRLGEFLQR